MKLHDLTVALISDELTGACLESECNVLRITPLNYRWQLRFRRPDFLLVESAWHGPNNRWKFKIAAYPDYPERNNAKLKAVVDYARHLGIPTVFWNKEDGVHFDRFIESAKLFDHIFTVDANCISRYRSMVGPEVTVNSLMFPVQHRHHYFKGFDFKHRRANFVGSYSHHIHDARRLWQDSFFSACRDVELGVVVYDRNSGRRSSNYRYPEEFRLEVLSAVKHEQTAQIYRNNLVSLNVNTIVDSPTMYSRRMVEILACGGIAVTNPSEAVSRWFQDYCHVVHDGHEARELFARLKHGPSPEDLERAEAGARYVRAEHTWEHRLQEIAQVIGL